MKSFLAGLLALLIALAISAAALFLGYRGAENFAAIIIPLSIAFVATEELGRWAGSRLISASPTWRWLVFASPFLLLEGRPTASNWANMLEADGLGALLAGVVKLGSLSFHVGASLLWGIWARGRWSSALLVLVITVAFHATMNLNLKGMLPVEDPLIPYVHLIIVAAFWTVTVLLLTRRPRDRRSPRKVLEAT